MKIIVDSSVWIDYFRSGENSGTLDYLIDEGMIATNDVILTEIIPPLIIKKQKKVVKILSEIEKIKMNVDWRQLREFQYKCLSKGVNGIGVPDLLIAQNAIQSGSSIFTLDKHFSLLKPVLDLNLY